MTVIMFLMSGCFLLASYRHFPIRIVFFFPGVGFINLPVRISTSSHGSPFQAYAMAVRVTPVRMEQYVHRLRSYFG